jgi:hypothetical protein
MVGYLKYQTKYSGMEIQSAKGLTCGILVKSKPQDVGMLMRRSGSTRWGRDSTGADFTAEPAIEGRL